MWKVFYIADNMADEEVVAEFVAEQQAIEMIKEKKTEMEKAGRKITNFNGWCLTYRSMENTYSIHYWTEKHN
jgi:hypothetical protein